MIDTKSVLRHAEPGDIKVGGKYLSRFRPNPAKESGFRFVARTLDNYRTDKIVLCDDTVVGSGQPTPVIVRRINKPNRSDRGAIIVEAAEMPGFELSKHVYVDPLVAVTLGAALDAGRAVALLGPCGCGKTTIAREIAISRGFEFVIFNAANLIEADDLVYRTTVSASPTGQALIQARYTELHDAVIQASRFPARKYLVFIDELNKSRALNSLFSALDGTRGLFDANRGAILEIPKNVRFVLAMNPSGGEYTSSLTLDHALSDRMVIIPLTYLPADAEISLLKQKHPSLEESWIKYFVCAANAVRKTASRGLSVRATEDACIFAVAQGFKSHFPDIAQRREAILKQAFCTRFPGAADDPSTEAGAVWTTIQQYIQNPF